MHIDPSKLPAELFLCQQSCQDIIDRKVNSMREYFGQSRFSRAVIGLSGGIDSAVSLALATRALGTDSVICVRLPCGGLTDSFHRAEEIALNERVPKTNLLTFDISEDVNGLARRRGLDGNSTDPTVRLRIGNIAARVRMITLMDVCTARRAMLIGTENLTEHHLAYFTIGGDSISNYEPFVGDMWKVQIFQLAAYLGLPESVLNCAPSAELWSGQTDEDELGFSYMAIDTVLHRHIVMRCPHYDSQLQARYGISESTHDKIIARYEKMKRKANAPFISP
jgi:NAD+ synthase